MRLLILLSLFIGIVFANPYKQIENYTLENGLKVYLLPDEKAKNVFIEVSVNVGMKVEDKEHAGISHLVEHIVFRDQGIENHDYFDLIKDKGATYVNGYTSYYKTRYVTMINPENATWITKTFCKMLFDKNVTNEDLRIEKGALQIEIGEPNWTDLFEDIKKSNLQDILTSIYPPYHDIYEEDFGIDRDADKIEYFNKSVYKENNKKFSLEEVLAYYHDYYYPSNMRLIIVGKFELKRIKKAIDDSFKKVKKRSGKTLLKPIFKDATLDDKPFVSYKNSGLFNKNSLSLGVKMLSDDPKKVVIIKSYVENLANRLNKEFRNKYGESYSTYGDVDMYHNAVIATINFSTSHTAYDKNMKLAKSWIDKETRGDINDSIISEAIKEKLKHFEAIEHDVQSLFNTVRRYASYKRIYPAKDIKLPITYMQEISPDEYRTILKDVFKPQHAFSEIKKDYIWFPYEGSILILVLGLIYIYMLMKFFNTKINKRKMLLERDISSFITIFIITSFAAIVASLLESWLVYAFGKITGISIYIDGFDIPFFYLIMIGKFIFSLLLLYLIVKKLFSWFYIRLIISAGNLYLVGADSKIIPLEDIISCEVVPWSPSLIKKSYGVAFLFWRPLLKITIKSEKILYIRYIKAKELQEDLSEIVKS